MIGNCKIIAPAGSAASIFPVNSRSASTWRMIEAVSLAVGGRGTWSHNTIIPIADATAYHCHVVASPGCDSSDLAWMTVSRRAAQSSEITRITTL